MNTFPTEAVLRLREIFTLIRSGQTTVLDHAVEIGYCLFTILNWFKNAGNVTVFGSDSEEAEAMQEVRFLVTDLGLELPLEAEGADPVAANGVIIGLLLKYLLTIIQDPEFWKRLFDLINKPK